MEEDKKTAGRPQAKIDWAVVDMMLEAGCKGTEIAARLGIYNETLYDACKREHSTDFSAYSQQKRESGDALLREKQMELAKTGNLGMLIWLGKQRLGQADKIETKNKHNVNAQMIDWGDDDDKLTFTEPGT